MIKLPRHKWTINPKTKIKKSKKIYTRKKKEIEEKYCGECSCHNISVSEYFKPSLG